MAETIDLAVLAKMTPQELYGRFTVEQLKVIRDRIRRARREAAS